jgi:hypothetical protein
VIEPGEIIEAKSERLGRMRPVLADVVFKFKLMSARQSRDARKMLKQAREEPDDEKADAMLADAICLGLAGWSGWATPFSRDTLCDIFTPAELNILADEVQMRPVTAQFDRLGKASASPS